MRAALSPQVDQLDVRDRRNRAYQFRVCLLHRCAIAMGAEHGQKGAGQPSACGVSFEVGMGAFIKTAYDPKDRQQKAAFSSYNSKRIDFLLIDKGGKPMLAVEYHGTGHDLSNDASDRMEVKRLALRRAGVALLEIPAKATKADMLNLITDKLGPTAT